MASDSKSSVSRDYRFQAGLPAILEDGGREHECTAHDLSRSGVLLSGAIPRPGTEEVELRIRSQAGDLDGHFIGRVARVEENGEGHRLAIEFVALDLEQKELLELLLARVIEGLAPAALEGVRPGAPVSEIRKALEAVPLAHRIALASRGNPRERELLRQDAQPQVLEALARNPNLLQAEARALAASPHLLPPTLEILATDPRWAADDETRILVVAHPRTPLALAERIADGLPPPALRRALTRSSLSQPLRERILKRLARR